MISLLYLVNLIKDKAKTTALIFMKFCQIQPWSITFITKLTLFGKIDKKEENTAPKLFFFADLILYVGVVPVDVHSL